MTSDEPGDYKSSQLKLFVCVRKLKSGFHCVKPANHIENTAGFASFFILYAARHVGTP